MSGQLPGRKVILAVTGIGKTCATMRTTLFVEKFQPREVLMTGTASRINPAVRNGDVIVGEVTCNHDFGSFAQSALRRLERPGADGSAKWGTLPSGVRGRLRRDGRCAPLGAVVHRAGRDESKDG